MVACLGASLRCCGGKNSGGALMDCAQCGHHNPVGTKFCGECGASLVLVCAACGTSNFSDNRFCGKCGRLLAQPSPAQSPAASRFASPQSYIPRHLAERILSSR